MPCPRAGCLLAVGPSLLAPCRGGFFGAAHRRHLPRCGLIFSAPPPAHTHTLLLPQHRSTTTALWQRKRPPRPNPRSHFLPVLLWTSAVQSSASQGCMLTGFHETPIMSGTRRRVPAFVASHQALICVNERRGVYLAKRLKLISWHGTPTHNSFFFPLRFW